MRARDLVAVGLLILPEFALAQRIPATMPGSHRPVRPAELPPQAPVVAKSQAIMRSKVSFENYPFMSLVTAPGFGGSGQVSRWANLSFGSRIAYQATSKVQGTMDITQSIVGGLAQTTTAEIGSRFQQVRSNTRAHPYLDLRVGYVLSQGKFATGPGGTAVPGSQSAAPGAGTSGGFAGVGGAGLEFAVTPAWSLTGGLTLLRSSMHSWNPYYYNSVPSAAGSFNMTALRFQFGIRFNPLRYRQLAQTVTEH
jgi:hypothetical protein